MLSKLANPLGARMKRPSEALLMVGLVAFAELQALISTTGAASLVEPYVMPPVFVCHGAR